MKRFNVLLSSAFCLVAIGAGSAFGQGFGGYVAPSVQPSAPAQAEDASEAGFAVSNASANAPANVAPLPRVPQTVAPNVPAPQPSVPQTVAPNVLAPQPSVPQTVVPNVPALQPQASQAPSSLNAASRRAVPQAVATPNRSGVETASAPGKVAFVAQNPVATQTSQTAQPAQPLTQATPIANKSTDANTNSAPTAQSAATNRAENTPQGGYLPDAQISNAIVPPPANYKPTETESLKLDEFLQHWENFGRGIKRISCDVHVKEFDDGVLQKNAKTPITHTWGLFRFIAPNKLLYHVKGEFSYDGAAQNGEPVWKDSQNEMKIVLDGKQFVHYDFASKTAVVYPIAEEDQNIDLSMDNGQFPLFFIAKAELLKNRFYMRLVTPKTKQQSEVWIEAFPRYARDAEQFRSIIVILGLKDMQPTYMRKIGVNGKSKTDLIFENLTINKGKWTIEGTVDPSWTKDVREEKYSLIQRGPEAPEYASASPVVVSTQTSIPTTASAPVPQTTSPTVAGPRVAANPNASAPTNAPRY